MDKGPDFPILLEELIVASNGFTGRKDLETDPLFLEEGAGALRDLEPAPKALRKDDVLCSVIQKFLQIGFLYTGIVTGPGLIPIPFPSPSRIELCVLETFPVPLDHYFSPSRGRDPWS